MITGICMGLSCKDHISGPSGQQKERLFKQILSQHSGIDFSNTIVPGPGMNIVDYNYFYNGGGVGAADFNNDGLTDLYFSGNQVSGKLYINRGGFKFADVTIRAGVTTHDWATGVAIADINNDGLSDIYLSFAGYTDPKRRANQLWINKGVDSAGVPHFAEEAKLFGLDDTSYTTQSAFFDFDRDGDLDLATINHVRDRTNPNFPKQKYPAAGSAGTMHLYRNDNGHFTEISKSAGLIEDGYGLGIGISDLNEDGWPDVYISKDFIYDDALYINNRDGTFTESLKQYIGHTSQFSMGCDLADFNNDGHPDILVADMLPEDNARQKMMNIAMNNDRFNYSLSLGYTPQYSRNMLQLNNGPDGNGKFSFSEIGQLAGIFKTDWSWSPLFADFDNDGWKDILITNGIPRDITNNDFITYRSEAAHNFSDPASFNKQLITEVENLDPVAKTNFLFKNEGNLRFKDKSHDWGFDHKGFSNGAAFVDLDNDGDLDIAINNLNERAGIFENTSERQIGNHYLRVKLTGHEPISCKLFVISKQHVQFIEHNPCRGFESSQDPVDHFGLGTDSMIDTLRIVWPDQHEQILTGIKADQTVTIEYQNARSANKTERSQNTIFSDITPRSGIDFTHQENSFEDFDLEPLLPLRYSRNGPAIATADVNGDGLEDFWIGGAAMSPGKLFIQNQRWHFKSRNMPDSQYEDVSGVFLDANGDNRPDLYVVSGGNEFKAGSESYQDRLYLNDGKGNFTRDRDALPHETISGGCVIANDFDKDGHTDLFAGGLVVPGKYPQSPPSFILKNDGKGIFRNITKSICPELDSIGMIRAAIWADVDNDGWADLILAGEWTTVMIFKNDHGKLRRMDDSRISDNRPGWWFSITGGDFDDDGDVDFIVGNLGLNNKYEASEQHPLTVYSKDFDANGSQEAILSYYLDGHEYPLKTRDEIAAVLPSIKKRFDTYSKFAKAGFADIFSKEDLKDALVLKASKFTSVYLENKGNMRFESHDLPIEAQFSPIRSCQTGDFNNDGHLDVAMIGNSFDPDFMTGRYDASIGCMLYGDGKSGFRAGTARETGLSVHGDARSSALITVKNEKWLITLVNSGKLQVFKWNKFPVIHNRNLLSQHNNPPKK